MWEYLLLCRRERGLGRPRGQGVCLETIRLVSCTTDGSLTVRSTRVRQS